MATSRYGIRADQPDSVWRDGINNWQACDAGLADPQWYGEGSGSLTDAVSRMLTPGYFDHWEPFASTVHNSPKNATNFMSLEYIHNIVHVSSTATPRPSIELMIMSITGRMLLVVFTCPMQTFPKMPRVMRDWALAICPMCQWRLSIRSSGFIIGESRPYIG